MHSPPPFVPADLRISPSGPYVNGGQFGGIMALGSDAIIEDLVIDEDAGTDVHPLLRSQTPDVALNVTFPSWRSADVLWVHWHVSGLWNPDLAATDEATTFLEIFPTVDVGTGPLFVDNAEVVSFPTFGVNEGGGFPQAASLAGVFAIPITAPAQPPIVQLYYALTQPIGLTSSFTIPGLNPAADTRMGSSWVTAAQISQEVLIQHPAEVTLIPV